MADWGKKEKIDDYEGLSLAHGKKSNRKIIIKEIIPPQICKGLEKEAIGIPLPKLNFWNDYFDRFLSEEEQMRYSIDLELDGI